MKWKKILKMPVPLGTEQTRDRDYTQAITEYEKTVIEPQVTKLLQQRMAGEDSTIVIGGAVNDWVSKNPPGYLIGLDKQKELGIV